MIASDMPALIALYVVVLVTIACYQVIKIYQKDIQKYHGYFALGASALFLLAAMLLNVLKHRLSLAFPLSHLSTSISPLSHWAIWYEAAFVLACYIFVIFIKNKEQRLLLKILFVAVVTWQLIVHGSYIYRYHKAAANCFESSLSSSSPFLEQRGAPIETENSLFFRRLFISLQVDGDCE